jgi:hypothetical protein
MRMTCDTHGEVDGLLHPNGHVYCRACVGEWHRRNEPTPQEIPIESSIPRRRQQIGGLWAVTWFAMTWPSPQTA